MEKEYYNNVKAKLAKYGISTPDFETATSSIDDVKKIYNQAHEIGLIKGDFDTWFGKYVALDTADSVRLGMSVGSLAPDIKTASDTELQDLGIDKNAKDAGEQYTNAQIDKAVNRQTERSILRVYQNMRQKCCTFASVKF